MKRLIAFLLVACLVLGLGACTSSPVAAGTAIEGNQEDFLKDMAAGINKRLSVNSDTTNMSREQVNKLYTKLVQYELDKIEKYDDAVFADEKFNDLAHTYIEACQVQKRACKYYKNDALYYGLWENSRLIRATVITELYVSYDLPLSAESAAEYDLSKQGGQYSVSVDGLEEFNNLFGGGDDVVLNVGDLRITDVSYEFVGSTNHKYDRYDIKYSVLNDSPYEMKSISLYYQITDFNGNILDTNSAFVNTTVASGKKVMMESSIYTDKVGESFKIVPEYFHYDGNGDSVVYDVAVDSKNVSEYTVSVS